MPKKTFILDENCLILAAKGINIKMEKSIAPLRLICTILDNCHKLGISPKLRKIYERKLDDFKENTPHGGTISKLIHGSLLNLDKIREGTPLALSDDEENCFHHKDLHLVRLAAALKGILVSEDTRLTKNPQQAEIMMNSRKFQILSISKAIQESQSEC
ncbi:MAG: hypothetical protein ACE5OZ_04480 [Candidatus Heimdallarchaeota archaeon]